MKRANLFAAVLFVAATCAGYVYGQGAGLADLDAAVETKLFARSQADMERVVTHCENAIRMGLDQDQERFAKLLLTSTLYEHADVLTQGVFTGRPAGPFFDERRKKSLELLEKAVAVDDQLSFIHYRIAQLHALPDGDRGKALEAVRAAVRTAKDDKKQLSDALLLRGNLSDDEQQKLADFNQAILINPENADALRTRGLWHLQNDNHEEAVADFTELLKINPDDLIANNALAEAFTNLQKFDEALAHLNKAIEASPDAAPMYTLRARVHAMKDDLKSAEADLNKALELEPRDAGSLLMRARLYLTKDDAKSAKKDIQQALIIRPGLVEGIMLRSVISADEGNFDAAAADMRLLLRAQPDNMLWRVQLARYYNAGKRPRAAVEIYTTILEEDPQNVDALRGRADALLSIGKHAEAIADFDEALKHAPEDSGVLNNLAWVLATSPEDKLRDGKRSIELGTKACEVTDFKQAHILSTLAAGYAEFGDFESAMKWSGKAVELGKDADEEMQKQLKAELDSYKEKKPWREKQTVEERPEPNRGGGNFEL